MVPHVVDAPARFADAGHARLVRGSAMWVTWQRHRRTREICRALDLPLIEIVSDTAGPLRYLSLLVRTALCVARYRPRVLFVQCPSVLLGVWAACLKPFYRYTLVADLHNEAVEPFIHSSSVYFGMLRLIRRAADLSLVSNDALIHPVESDGGKAYVLPDRVPQMPMVRGADVIGASSRVVCVSTYAPDEPYLAVFEAARLLGPSVELAITGDYRHVPLLPEPPPSVTLTGFLPQPDYDRLLQEADVIVDLTLMENCLVCGGYEAVALEKPLVTSATVALRRFFRRGTVYTQPDPESLAAAISDALRRRAALAGEMKALKEELSDAWTRQKDELARLLALPGR